MCLSVLQVISPTRPCPLRGHCPGYRASSATLTTPVSVIPPQARVLDWWGTSTIQCERDSPLVGHRTHFILLVSPDCVFLLSSISRLFIDAKKILLYTQNDKSYEGYVKLLRALRKMQKNTARKHKQNTQCFTTLCSVSLNQLKPADPSLSCQPEQCVTAEEQEQEMCRQNHLGDIKCVTLLITAYQPRSGPGAIGRP